MADITTDAAQARSETSAPRATMKAVGVYERPKRLSAAPLPRPLALALLILAIISFIILLKNLF